MPFAATSDDDVLEHDLPARQRAEYAMPAPIIPAPRTATFVGAHRAYPAGREAPPEIACMSKKNALVMFLATCPVTRSTKYRVSMRSAVSTSTWVPSTAAARMLRGAGQRGALELLAEVRRERGQDGGELGRRGVPPGIW